MVIINYLVTRSRPEETITLDDFKRDVIYIDNYVSDNNKNIILNTYFNSLKNKSDFYLEMFSQLLLDPIVYKSLLKIDVNVLELKKYLDNKLKEDVVLVNSEEVRKYVALSFIEAISLRENFISRRGLFLALFNDNYSGVHQLKCQFNIDKKDLYNALILASVPIPHSDELTSGVGDFMRLRMKYGYRFKVNRS